MLRRNKDDDTGATSRGGATRLDVGKRLGGATRLGRAKQDDAAPATETTPAQPVRPGAKNRPTPSRREAEAARRHPLVPADRKAAQKESRQRERQERARIREAMAAGEEWALPERDRGKERAFIRDYIDARWNLAEFLLPVLILGLPISLFPDRSVMAAGYAILYGAIVAAMLDLVFLWFTIRKRVTAKFGERPKRGSGWYVVSRAMQMRMSRVPRPRVKRGQYPV